MGVHLDYLNTDGQPLLFNKCGHFSKSCTSVDAVMMLFVNNCGTLLVALLEH
jgi:hypothetical protein